MVERAFHHPHVLCHTGPEAKDYWRVLLTAALTTHTIVPLASAEPELWLARDINRTAVFASDSFNTPLYRGLIPTTEGASNGA
jgi:hypothetical protein